MSPFDRLLTNASIIDAQGHQHKGQAVAISNGKIAWVGPQNTFSGQALVIEDCQERLITPAWVDCHTHLVYAGDRVSEFQLRLDGKSYAEIAQSGGGILSTVRQTRAASEEQLILQSLPRILALRAEGVLSMDIKSGYGLDLENELKMLSVARKLGKLAKVRVRTSFLGAHAIPPEYTGRKQAYVDFLCEELLPRVAQERLADAVDVFSESIAFDLQQTEQIYQKAKELGFAIRCHAEQLSSSGAAKLASEYAALSCDHLEYLNETGAKAMAKSGTTAVLLPGAYYFLQESQKPPIALLRKQGVGMAVATDCNPGSSPTCSLRLMMSMACQLFAMTVPEVLAGVTYQAAKALGLEKQTGSIQPGLDADLLRWPFKDAAELCYYFGYPLKHETMVAGFWSTE